MDLIVKRFAASQDISLTSTYDLVSWLIPKLLTNNCDATVNGRFRCFLLTPINIKGLCLRAKDLFISQPIHMRSDHLKCMREREGGKKHWVRWPFCLSPAWEFLHSHNMKILMLNYKNILEEMRH